MQSLSLAIVQVSDILPLSKLTNLRTLDLSDTEVRDIQPLAGLTKLQGLELIAAPVEDLQIEHFKKAHPMCHVR